MWFDRAVEPFAVLLLTADDPALQRCAPHDLQVASHEDDAALDHFLQVLEGLSLERHFVLLYELLSLGTDPNPHPNPNLNPSPNPNPEPTPEANPNPNPNPNQATRASRCSPPTARA